MTICKTCGYSFTNYCARCSDYEIAGAVSQATDSPKPNVFERLARARKVQKLVSELDYVMTMSGVVHPYQDAHLIAKMLGTEGVCWRAIAHDAGVKAPSAETINQVRAVYASRAVKVAS